jgi:hypothetical protein
MPREVSPQPGIEPTFNLGFLFWVAASLAERARRMTTETNLCLDGHTGFYSLITS